MSIQDDLNQQLAALKAAQASNPNPEAAERRDRLHRLEHALQAWEDRLVAAMSDDFGYRVPLESRFADIIVPIASIRHARRRLARWMRPRRVPTPLHLLPARASVHPVPKGVIGIISPWNFPCLLTLAPLIDALAAGNRVFIKPSELTDRTSGVMADMLAEAFRPDEVAVVQGGADVSALFSGLPFDHLVFTGSTATGRKVARAAAENLVPVTLELGGKSPLIFGQHGDVNRLIDQVIFGKFLNAGQACVAPDYMLVPEAMMGPVVDALKAAMTNAFADWSTSASLTAVAGASNHDRLNRLVDDVRNRAADVWRPSEGEGQNGRFAPTLILRPPLDADVMTEEIFGPVLPIIPYTDLPDAERIVARNSHPLAMYLFTNSRRESDHWIARVPAGAVAVNDCLVQLVTDTIPFGGVGTSGFGAYHGRWGFDAFSHLKAVLRQSRWNTIKRLTPPYGLQAQILAKTFRRIVQR